MRNEIELPIAQCHLDAAGLREQADRYRRLGASATRVDVHAGVLTVIFEHGLDEPLLDEAIAVERGCCPFFDFQYQPEKRRLSIAVQKPDQRPALEALHYALTGREPAAPARSE
jgi:hypothetical protein